MPPMELGDATVAGVMEGSFLSPDMRLSWEAPAAAASGSVDLSRDSNSFTCRAPAVDVSASLLLKPAPFDAVKTVLTQVSHGICRPHQRLMMRGTRYTSSYAIQLLCPKRSPDGFPCWTKM